MIVYMYVRVFVLKLVMHLSFPRINKRLRITQTNSMSANFCQILPLFSDSLIGSTAIFFLCFSVRCVCVFERLELMPCRRLEVPTLTPPRPKIQLHTAWPEF